MPPDLHIPVTNDADIIHARQSGRTLAQELGFSTVDQALIATAISEIARNIVQYAARGTMALQSVEEPSRRGILIIATDQGPGIPDVNLALQDGYSTGGGLGLGLPGAKRLMDEFEIDSVVGQGTTITMKKWVRANE